MIGDREISSASKEDIFKFIAKYWKILIRRWSISLIIFFAVLVVGVYIMTFQRKIYEATAMVQILHESPNALGYKELTKTEVKDFEDVNTKLNAFGAKGLLLSVLASMSYFDKKNLLFPYFSNWKELSEAEIYEFVLSRRNVNLLRKSYIVNISFNHCSPEVAAMMANKFADFFCEFSLKAERDVVLKSINDLTDKVNSQRKVIEDQERKLSKYRETCGAISLDSKDDIAHQQLTVLNNALVNKKLEYDLLKNSCLLVKEYKEKSRPLITLPFVCASGYVESILSGMSRQRAKISALSERYGSKYPLMVHGNTKLNQLQSELDSAMEFVISGVASKKTKAKREYHLLLEKLKQKESELIELSRIAVEYNSLRRDLDVSLNLYNTINSRLHEQVAQLNVLMPNVIIIDRALPPDLYVWPDFRIEFFAFMLLGMMLGVLYIVIAEIFDARIRCGEDVRKLFGENVFGFIKAVNQHIMESSLVSVSIKIDNALKKHRVNAINVIGKMPMDLVPCLADSFISLGANVLVIADRPIVFHGKLVPYKEIDGGIGHIGIVNERSTVLSLSKNNPNLDEKTLRYIHEVKKKYDKVIISFRGRGAYKIHNLFGDELALLIINYNSTKTADIFHYMENSLTLREKMYCIVLS
ncbi:MAG: GumC family protein [Puniceicoccales bacterium]|jgi:uncharacterized protein involved in exopolysaccharide biosynthesis|nr:GumC family protein [Puniceicoccales bacterium]